MTLPLFNLVETIPALIGISTIGLVWKHVHHYIKVAPGHSGFASSAGIVLLIIGR